MTLQACTPVRTTDSTATRAAEHRLRAAAGVALLAAACMLGGCSKREPAPASAPAAPPASAVVPQPSDVPASANANGPADGATAVGGMSANQDSGGAKPGSAAAPTGGDGAASAPAAAPK